MATVLQVVGFGWAVLGMANLFGMFSKGVSEGVATFGLLINVLLFILPGLAIGGIGTMMKNRAKAQIAEKSQEQSRIEAAVAAAIQAERAKH